MAKPQDALDNIWGNYRKSLTELSAVLDVNEALRADADIDFTMPEDIAKLEATVNDKLAQLGIE